MCHAPSKASVSLRPADLPSLQLEDPAAFAETEDLLLLPSGRSRLRASASQAGGLPRRFPRPRANRSKLMIASSICSRSWRNSVRILVTSMGCPQLVSNAGGRSDFGTDFVSSRTLLTFYPISRVDSSLLFRFQNKDTTACWRPEGYANGAGGEISLNSGPSSGNRTAGRRKLVLGRTAIRAGSRSGSKWSAPGRPKRTVRGPRDSRESGKAGPYRGV